MGIALAMTVPEDIIEFVAPVTLEDGIFNGNVIILSFGLCVVGVPVIVMVTTVAFVRTAVLAVSPGGRLLMVKSADVIVVA